MFSSILVICTGNICRSPYGEHRLRQEMPTIKVSSAGIAVEKSLLVGQAADSQAISVALDFGVDVSQHKAKQVTQKLIDEHELILCMEPNQLEVVCQMYEGARHKSFLFGHWIGVGEVNDPYRQEEQVFKATFSTINRATSAWSKRIRR